MNYLDYGVITAFFLMLLYVGLRSAKNKSIISYWLNNRSSGLWLLTFSNVASITIASAVIGVVAAVYQTGISFAISSVTASVVGMFILAKVTKKMYEVPEKCRFTLVDIFEWRFGKKTKQIISILLVSVLFLLISVNIVAITQLGSVLTNLDYNVFLIVSFSVVILYTTLGGMKTDLLTDFIQFWFMGGMIIVLFIMGSLNGGISSISTLPATYFDPFAFGGVGFLVGSVLIGGFVYLMNSATWQRAFSAQTKETAQKSFYLSIPFMILFSSMIAVIGLFSVSMVGNVHQDKALYLLIDVLLPNGLIGLGYAGIISLILSSVDSLLIGGSTILNRAVFKDTSLKNARQTTLFLGVVATIIAYFFPNVLNLALFASFLMLALMPSLLFGLYSRKANTTQALISIVGATIVLVICSFFIYKIAFVPAVLFGIIAFFIPVGKKSVVRGYESKYSDHGL